MAKKRIASFRGKTRTNASRRKQGRGFEYLTPPNGVEIFKPEIDTKYVIDFMPYEVTDKNHPDKDEKNEIAVVGTYWYKRPFRVHTQVGANNEKVLCPRSIGRPCPICDYQDELRKNNGDEEEIKMLYPKDRNLYAVMFPEDRKLKGQILLFDFSDYLFQEKFELQLQDQEEFDYFPDHLEGCSVKVAFSEGSFGKNKYAEPTRFDFEERRKQYTDEILDKIPKLDECFFVMTYEELKAKFFEVPIEDEDEGRERKWNKKKEKDLPFDDNEEEEEEEYDQEDEEEEEEEEYDQEEEEEEEYDQEDEEEEEEEKSLFEQVENARSLNDLISIVHDNSEFKKNSRKLAKITKKSELRKAMLAILGNSEEPEQEEEKPKRKTKEKAKKCPHDYEFGIDTDEYDECDECDQWQACYKKQQKEE